MTRQWTPIREYREILFDFFEGIARITINRPRYRNAVTPLTVAEIGDALRYCREAQDICVVVLTGGGSRLRNIDRLSEQVLGMHVRIGRPIHVDGLEQEPFPAAYATVAGALLYAHRNYEEKSILDGLFGRFFR